MPMSDLRFKKGSDEQVSPYFKAREFDCPCSNCTETPLDSTLVERLTKMREALGVSIRINSGYRCDRHQQELAAQGYETAKGISTHQLGKAADICTGAHAGPELEVAARRAGFRAVGVGSNWAHVDCRDDRDRSWSYVKERH